MWMPTAPPDLARLLAWHPQPVPILPLLCLLALVLTPRACSTAPQRGPLAGRADASAGSPGWLSVVAGHRHRHRRLRHGAVQRPHGPAHGAEHVSPDPAADGRADHPRPAGPAQRPGRRGRARRLLLRTLHSRAARVLTSPAGHHAAVPRPASTGSTTPRSSTGPWADPVGHTGCSSISWSSACCSSGRSWRSTRARTPASVIRILELFITTPFHAFFGIAVMSSTTLIAIVFAHPPIDLARQRR